MCASIYCIVCAPRLDLTIGPALVALGMHRKQEVQLPVCGAATSATMQGPAYHTRRKNCRLNVYGSPKFRRQWLGLGRDGVAMAHLTVPHCLGTCMPRAVHTGAEENVMIICVQRNWRHHVWSVTLAWLDLCHALMVQIWARTMAGATLPHRANRHDFIKI
jgi:hypothetical protein